MNRPTSVTVSFWIWLIVVLLGLVNGVAGLFAQASQGQSSGAIVSYAIGDLLIALVELFIVFRMRTGRNWARIVLLVLAILQVLSIFGPFQAVVGWIGVVAVIIAAILMFVGGANAYFRKR